MNYEEKYKQALEREKEELRVCGSQDCDAARQIFRFFPELQENEDERIRKVLLNDFKNNCSEYYCEGVTRDMIIAWFEKQGEKDKLIKEYEKYITWLEKQNPSWSEKDKNLLNRLIGVLDGTNEEDYHEAWEETFLPWLKSIKERIRTQPKQCEQLENYDEDDRIRKGIIRNLQYLMDRSEGFVKEDLQERIDWLEKQKPNTHKREIDDAYLQGICDAKHEIEKQGESTITNIEIPFGASDSELQEVSYYIPEGFYAKIKDDRVVIKKVEHKALNADEVIAWLNDQACLGWIEDVEVDKFIEKFKKDFGI